GGRTGYGRVTLSDPWNFPPVKTPLTLRATVLPEVPADDGKVSIALPAAPAAMDPTERGSAVVVAAVPRVDAVMLTSWAAKSPTEKLWKLAPLTVRVKAGLPASRNVGLMAVSDGTGWTPDSRKTVPAPIVPPRSVVL